MSTAPKPAPVSLIRASAAELDEVMHIMASAFSTEFGEAWTRSQCSGILPMSGVALTLARSPAAEAQGFSLMRTVADEAELLLIAVAPEARGRGIGQALLERFITDAADKGVSRLHLEVRDGNDALRLYRGAGFAPVGRRRDYYRGADGSRFDAITLARDAEPA